jgi:regulator of extracellular matrix RemA (YlzA/DUF370 family)
MGLKILNVGFDNIVSADRVVAVVMAQAAPVRRLIDEARKKNKLIDATNGRKTKTAVVTDSDHVILSAMQPSTITQRMAAR